MFIVFNYMSNLDMTLWITGLLVWIALSLVITFSVITIILSSASFIIQKCTKSLRRRKYCSVANIPEDKESMEYMRTMLAVNRVAKETGIKLPKEQLETFLERLSIITIK